MFTSIAFSVLSIGVIVSGIFILLLHKLAQPLGLIDSPCERKAHKGNVPLVGGVAVFLASTIMMLIFLDYSINRNLLIVASGLIVFIGVLDDKYDLTVRSRLIGQSFVSLILIFGIEKHFVHLGDLISLGNFFELGVFGIPFTVLAVLAVINAFNMIDGIDGLLGAVSAVFFVALGIQSASSENSFIFITCLILVACLVPFLMANLGFRPIGNKKIFMGDAGSMLMGLLVVWLVVESSQGESSFIRPVTFLFFAALPIIDMVAIIIRRLRKGKSPFVADRDHIHHIFMRGGLTSKQTLLVLSLFSILSALFGLVLEYINVPDLIVLLSFSALCLAYSFMVLHSWKFCRWLRARMPNQKNLVDKV